MMGIQGSQDELFIYGVNLEERVRANHPLRRIKEIVDFSFVRKEVADCYGYNGNESVDPEVIMKLMFLLFYDNVHSERLLMEVVPERLDYLWFLGYGLGETVPNHSVLSKARKRWGAEVFEKFFVRMVQQCVAVGLVEGSKLHMDGSLIAANASNNAVVKGPPELIAQLKKVYKVQEEKLDESGHIGAPNYEPVNDRMMNRTDPDATMVRTRGQSLRPRYKSHRAIDDVHGVITAVETTSGDVTENTKLISLVEQSEANTKTTVDTVVADSQYGTIDNFRTCHERGIRSHMADLSKARGRTRKQEQGIYTEKDFTYHPETDTYTCPAGQTLRRRKHHTKRRAYEYAAGGKVCAACSLRSQCTTAKNGRYLRRHENHEAVVAARLESASPAARRDRHKRQWFMEGSFAQATNYHFKHSRWRRLDRQRIQDYLIAAIQNIKILLKAGPRDVQALGVALSVPIRLLSVRLSFVLPSQGVSVSFLRHILRMISDFFCYAPITC